MGYSGFIKIERQLKPEQMDDPNLPEKAHRRALAGLARINFLSRADSMLWNQIKPLVRPGERLRLLDVATGSGDLPIRLSLRASGRLQIAGCDVSPTAIAVAQENARRAKAAAQFFELNPLTEPLPAGFDLISASLFLHHLEQSQAISLIRKMADAAKKMILLCDLIRCRAGLGLAYAGTRILTRSKVVHADGVQSVRAAFTPEEALGLAHAAGLDQVKLKRHFPFRFLLTWKKS